MTQYDAGPGDWSDREWEAPAHKRQPHAKRRGLVLPPWALLASLVAIVALLCAGLIIVVRALRGGAKATTTPEAALTQQAGPTETVALLLPTADESVTPTATVVIPIGITDQVPTFTQIGIGAMVVVRGTGGAGLNVRAEPAQTAHIVVTVKENATLTVLEGPSGSDDFKWWKVRTSDGKEGWAVERYLVLKEGQ